MPIGIITNVLTVFLGGIFGAYGGKIISKSVKEKLSDIFGLLAIAIGVISIMGAKSVPVTLLSVILGTIIGEYANLEKKTTHFFNFIIKKFLNSEKEMDMEKYIALVAIFCVSGLGIFGVLQEGMTSDSSILFSKSIFDFFTAAIFATVLGISVSLIAPF